MTSSNLNVTAIIPARYQSTRFPGKPLALLQGRPMIQWVYEKALQVQQVDAVYVATDHEDIAECVRSFGGNVLQTRSDHPTGTDRLVEASQSLETEWILNLQGDEPLIHPGDLEQLIEQTLSQAQDQPSLSMSTLRVALSPEDSSIKDPHTVKVVCDHQQHALYFSRAPIPHQSHSNKMLPAWKHMGIYLYRRSFLQQFARWPQTPLEQVEQLEQLRVLENGHSILCVDAQQDSIGVDVPEDLIRAEQKLTS